MDDEQLIKLVKQYPVLYDLTHPRYMDSPFRYIVWSKIAANMKNDVSTCKARWNNIRDNYRKSLRKSIIRSGQGCRKLKLYKYSDQLSFLMKHLEEKESKENNENEEKQKYGLEETKEYTRNEGKETSHGNDMPNSEGPNTSNENEKQPQTSVRVAKRKLAAKRKRMAKRTAPQETASVPQEVATIKSVIPNTCPIKNNQTDSSQHPVDAFLAGIAPVLKSINPLHLHLAKSEIFSTVQKYEMKMLIQQQTQQNCTLDNSSNQILSNSITSSNNNDAR